MFSDSNDIPKLLMTALRSLSMRVMIQSSKCRVNKVDTISNHIRRAESQESFLGMPDLSAHKNRRLR